MMYHLFPHNSNARRICKKWALQAAAAGGVFTVARWWTRRKIRILAYHGVTDQVAATENADGFFVSTAVFEAHLRTLSGHYHVLPLTEIVEALTNGTALPHCAAAITFDDGYANNAEIAAPILKRYGLPATFFVTTGFIDGTHQPWWAMLRTHAARAGWSHSEIAAHEHRLKNCSAVERDPALKTLTQAGSDSATATDSAWRMMTWDQVRDLSSMGFDVGPHTVSHISMGHEDVALIEREIKLSNERILAEVGKVAKVYAYPYGQPEHIRSDWRAILKRERFLGGVTTVDGLNSPQQDPYALYRLNVTENHHRNAFRALAAGCTTAGKGLPALPDSPNRR